jgi:hypothetical protein
MNTVFNKHIDLRQPDYIIDLVNIKNYVDLKRFLQKKLKLKSYVYAFQLKHIPGHMDQIINIGMSSKSNDCRLYRKAGHISGWGRCKLEGDSGSDMETIVIPRVQEKYPHVTVHKNDITVLIWDTTHHYATHYGKCPTEEAEKQLFEDYDNMYDGIPVGNIQDPRTRNKTHGPSYKQFSELFY